MHKLNHMTPLSLLVYSSFLFFLLSYPDVGDAGATANPFTSPKASLIRYWKIQISNDLPKPCLGKHDNNIDSYPNYGDQPNVDDDVYEKYDQSNIVNDGFKNDKSSPANSFKYDKSNPTNAFKYDKLSPANEFKYDKLSPAKAFKYDKSSTSSMGMMMMGGKVVSKWVEPGKFFRERMLKAGTIMPMPDIKDKMPKRSFLHQG
ncbi:hypothetical protein RHSIM_Rhsim12G0118900 [Rhododendron simsii]|uniref:BURP domain-containing protein n=1 Tax=Rhododendron simsii TaxID=118357 RepID=A0A834G311_RHOSS|nr:hypothetical protein RHSIM_Rhsim12G0118900 [Rhododendron simsii]